MIIMTSLKRLEGKRQISEIREIDNLSFIFSVEPLASYTEQLRRAPVAPLPPSSSRLQAQPRRQQSRRSVR